MTAGLFPFGQSILPPSYLGMGFRQEFFSEDFSPEQQESRSGDLQRLSFGDVSGTVEQLD